MCADLAVSQRVVYEGVLLLNEDAISSHGFDEKNTRNEDGKQRLSSFPLGEFS
jgi:hypothetical protein